MRGGGRGRGRGGYRGNHGYQGHPGEGHRGGKGYGNANLADGHGNAETNDINGDIPAYNTIFGGLAYCLKAALNGKI